MSIFFSNKYQVIKILYIIHNLCFVKFKKKYLHHNKTTNFCRVSKDRLIINTKDFM